MALPPLAMEPLPLEVDVHVPVRRFVPPALDTSRAEALHRLAGELLERPIGSAQELADWITDWGELRDCVLDGSHRRHLASDRDTRDAALAREYSRYQREVATRWSELDDALNRRLLASPFLAELPRGFDVLVRDRRAAAELFRPENLERQRADEEGAKRFGRIQGEVQVELDGRVLTAAEVGARQYLKDRGCRDVSWRLLALRRLEDREAIDALLDELVALRHEMARCAGHPDYVRYRFVELRRFDYTPEDCDALALGVERHVVPLLAEMRERRRRALGLERLRPWDQRVDPWAEGDAPLFRESDELAAIAGRVFERIDPELAAWFDILRRNALLDLPSRPGKAPGGYSIDLPSLRLPFLFLNAVGAPHDLEVMLHEAGHGFHTIACREREPADYRDCPSEFCEVASMSMELFGLEALPVVLGPERARPLARSQLESVVAGLCQTALVDSFQRWMYKHPGHSREERRARWLELHRRFMVGLDWESLEEERAHDWQRIPHLFHGPLYFIEYGIAQLGALQVWRNARRDPARGLRLYREALALGGSRPLPELFAAAGARFSFEPDLIGELIGELRPLVEELER